ncbi:MAG: hypothetical protein B6U89_01755 [Desulfurococcales archaeon ex4484_58]|nr:MAG: hypothetical protein B6U89_01755 [Desulfurococcales archaeon ex4484_58]
MKAISPVIATLILIAIAVIAGVFVLRNFILLSTTTATQQFLQIQDAVLLQTVKHQKINLTYYVDWLSVTLQISIKNTGDRVVTITNITVGGLPLSGFTPVNVNPGDVFTGSYPVVLNPATGETKIPYTATWEKGTEHEIVVKYVVLGSKNEQVVTYKAIVQ